MVCSTRTLFASMACGLVLVGGPLVAVAVAGTPASRASGTTTTSTTATPTTTTTTTTTTGPTTTSQTDAASNQSALTDYRRYLSALVKGTQVGVQRDASFAANIRQACTGVLSSVSTLPAAKVSATVLSQLGEEIGGDLALEFLSEADQPFAQLSTALNSLPWTEAPPPEAIDGLLTAESAVLGLTPSPLCADARALAKHPRLEPSGSKAFLGSYLSDSATLKQQLTDFLSVLSRFATTRDSHLIKSIDQLVAKFASASASVERADAATVLTTLGLSG
jgi:hypothetical protein